MPMKIETDEEYHGGEGVSKSGLWELWTKTPFHYRHVERKPSKEKELGKAAHVAILEPETLETRVSKGPADRRGNKWKEFIDFCTFAQTIPLTEGDFEQAMRIRDASEMCEPLRLMRGSETIVETSAYHVDEETGVLVKTRPDMFNIEHKIICDIKTAASASPDAFAKAVGKFGYHVQDTLYQDVWSKGAGYEVEAFFFVVFEKSDPPMVAVYELDAATAAEGHAVYRAALAKYAECYKADEWPGYSGEVKTLSLKRWDYRLTKPEAEDITGEDD
jgi:hypothetical protein